MQDVDLLSTIALALAILAFSAQIAISLAQVQQGAQQLASTERINTETRSLLTQMNAQSSALLTNQAEQFNRVLDAALKGDAIAAAVEEVASREDAESDSGSSASGASSKRIDSEALSESIRENLLSALSSSSSPARDWGESVSRKEAVQQNLPFIEVLSSWPSEAEGRVAAQVFDKLSPWETALLARRASADLARARAGRHAYGWTKINPDDLGQTTKTLVELGIFEYTRGPQPRKPENEVWLRKWTPLGLSVARLLTAEGESPQWLRDRQNPSGSPTDL